MEAFTQENVPLTALRETTDPLRQAPKRATVEAMADDLLNRGQLSPLLATREADGTFVVVDGRARLRALLKLQADGHTINPVPVLAGDRRSVRTTCADANLGRPLTAAEQALNIRALDDAAAPQMLGVSVLADGRPAGQQHQPGLNALVGYRYGLSAESARKAIYRARIPAEVLHEVLGTERDRREALTRAGREAVRAYDAGEDAAAAARAALRDSAGTKTDAKPRWERLAEALNAEDVATVRAIGEDFGGQLTRDAHAALLEGLRKAGAGHDAAPADDQKTGARDHLEADRQTAAAPAASPDAVTQASAAAADNCGGGSHADGGPRGGLVDAQRAARVRRKLIAAKSELGSWTKVQELTGIPRATLSNVKAGRTPAADVADRVEATLPPSDPA
jgi:ParB-like chromosome segregation protein Spo0J